MYFLLINIIYWLLIKTCTTTHLIHKTLFLLRHFVGNNFKNLNRVQWSRGLWPRSLPRRGRRWQANQRTKYCRIRYLVLVGCIFNHHFFQNNKTYRYMWTMPQVWQLEVRYRDAVKSFLIKLLDVRVSDPDPVFLPGSGSSFQIFEKNHGSGSGLSWEVEFGSSLSCSWFENHVN